MKRALPLTTALLLALVASSAQANEIGEVKCSSNLGVDLRPHFDESQIEQNCSKSTAVDCNHMLRKIYMHFRDVSAEIRSTCNGINGMAASVASAATSGQKDSNIDAMAVLKSTSTNVSSLIKRLRSAYSDTHQAMRPLLQQRIGEKRYTGKEVLRRANKEVGPRKQLIAELISNEDKLGMKITFPVAHTLGESSLNDRNLFGSQNGLSFLRGIVRNRKELEKIESQITGIQNKVANNTRDLGKAPEPSNTKTDDSSKAPPAAAASGLDMKTLTGLATAGMGLAQMMKKQDSGISEEPPTPTDPAVTPESKPAPAASKFSPEEKPGEVESPIKMVMPAKKEEPTSGPRSMGLPAFDSGSGISDSSDRPAAAAFTPAKASAPGGSGGGPLGGEGSSPKAANARAPASPAKQEEEPFNPGGGGGGGGGYGGSPGGTASEDTPASLASEDPMRDLLNEMKDAANSGGEPGSEQAENAVPAMDDKDLFPRVHAAHVRSLKRGLVLNGLADRILPD